MKLPRNSTKILLFKHKNSWYQIVQVKDKYVLYKQLSDNDYEQLATGNNPKKLEQKITSKGK